MKPTKMTISLSLDSDVVERLRILAEEKDRSLSAHVNLVLRDYLRRQDEAKD